MKLSYREKIGLLVVIVLVVIIVFIAWPIKTIRTNIKNDTATREAVQQQYDETQRLIAQIPSIEANINSAIEKFDGDIIVFADLLCGSPFNVATMAALKDERIRVVYGTNLGMLVESIMSLSQGMNTDELVDKAVMTGKTQVGKFEKSSDEEDDFDN